LRSVSPKVAKLVFFVTSATPNTTVSITGSARDEYSRRTEQKILLGYMLVVYYYDRTNLNATTGIVDPR